MNVTEQVRKEVDEFVSRLSADEVRVLTAELHERFTQENEDLRAIYREDKAIELVIDALVSSRRGDPEVAADRLVSAYKTAKRAIELRLVDATIETLKLRREVNLNIVERNQISMRIREGAHGPTGPV